MREHRYDVSAVVHDGEPVVAVQLFAPDDTALCHFLLPEAEARALAADLVEGAEALRRYREGTPP